MHQIAFIVSPGFQLISLAALSAFEIANRAREEPLYDIRVLSEKGGKVSSSMGVDIATSALDDGDHDTVIFSGGLDRGEPTPAVLDFARRAAQNVRRIASICTGAEVLANAGILDGRKAATHWAAARSMQERFPQIDVDSDKIYLVDGNIWTSAGASAGIDLALGMIEEDLGREAAKHVSRQLVLYHRRGGGQSQHSALLEMDAQSDRIRSALNYARANIAKPLTVEIMADAAGLSPRQFSRAFKAETGNSPAKGVENLRVESARIMMEQTRHSIDTIARATGFNDRERMRRAFLRAFGLPPQAVRRAG
jgi:transcriptional regulator GlxA family with amidase domain